MREGKKDVELKVVVLERGGSNNGNGVPARLSDVVIKNTLEGFFSERKVPFDPASRLAVMLKVRKKKKDHCHYLVIGPAFNCVQSQYQHDWLLEQFLVTEPLDPARVERAWKASFGFDSWGGSFSFKPTGEELAVPTPA